MGREALLQSLRAKAEEDRAALWRDARAAADAFRAELARRADEERQVRAAALAALRRALDEEAEVEATRRSREREAAVSVALGERCRRLAVEALARLRDERGDATFLLLAAELPGLDWRRVAVNPADEALAKSRFPGASVTCDPSIHGGVDVATIDGRIRVSNTLDTRLATAWPDLLPQLLAELRKGTEP